MIFEKWVNVKKLFITTSYILDLHYEHGNVSQLG